MVILTELLRFQDYDYYSKLNEKKEFYLYYIKVLVQIFIYYRLDRIFYMHIMLYKLLTLQHVYLFIIVNQSLFYIRIENTYFWTIFKCMAFQPKIFNSLHYSNKQKCTLFYIYFKFYQKFIYFILYTHIDKHN